MILFQIVQRWWVVDREEGSDLCLCGVVESEKDLAQGDD